MSTPVTEPPAEREIFHLRPAREKTVFHAFGPYMSGMDVERYERHLAQVRVAGARVSAVPADEQFHDYWPKACLRCNAPVDEPWEPEEEVDPDLIF